MDFVQLLLKALAEKKSSGGGGGQRPFIPGLLATDEPTPAGPKPPPRQALPGALAQAEEQSEPGILQDVMRRKQSLDGSVMGLAKAMFPSTFSFR